MCRDRRDQMKVNRDQRDRKKMSATGATEENIRVIGLTEEIEQHSGKNDCRKTFRKCLTQLKQSTENFYNHKKKEKND